MPIPQDARVTAILSDDATKKAAAILAAEAAPATPTPTGLGGGSPPARKISTAGPITPPLEVAKEAAKKAPDGYDAFDPDGEHAAAEKEEAKRVEEQKKADEAKKAEEDARKSASAVPPQHSDRLLRLAAFYGISASEAGKMTADDLRSEIATAKLEAETMDLAERRKAAQAEAAKTAPPKPAEDEIDWGEIDDGTGKMRKATEDDVAPGLVLNIKNLIKKDKERDAAVKELMNREVARQQQAQMDLLDSAFAELPANLKPIFGNLSAGEIDWNNAEHQALVARRNAAITASGADDKKDSPALIKKKIQQAATKLFGSLAPAATPTPNPTPANPVTSGARSVTPPKTAKPDTEVEPEKKEWEEAALVAPTTHNGAPKRGRQAAYNEYDKIFERVKARDGDRETDDGSDPDIDDFGLPEPRR